MSGLIAHPKATGYIISMEQLDHPTLDSIYARLIKARVIRMEPLSPLIKALQTT